MTTEVDIIKRLDLAGRDALHPLLVPGILIELERQRHVIVAKDAIVVLETQIYQLNPRPDTTEVVSLEAMEAMHREKRTKWLDMSYIRNCLISWRDQLSGMKLYLAEVDARESNGTGYALGLPASQIGFPGRLPNLSDGHMSRSGPQFGRTRPMHTEFKGFESDSDIEDIFINRPDSSSFSREIKTPPARQHHIYETGFKIRSRVHGLLREYDDLIRDCTMRIDGMSMATQWVSLWCPINTLMSLFVSESISRVRLTRLMSNRHKERPTWKSQRRQVGTRSTCDLSRS